MKIVYLKARNKIVLKDIKAPDKSGILRDHLANERTFLAWTRTSIGIMAFGFVVEKFSLFIKEMATFLGKAHIDNTPHYLQGASSIFGIALVALGALICLLAFFKYKMIFNQIEDETVKPSMKLNILLTFFHVSTLSK